MEYIQTLTQTKLLFDIINKASLSPILSTTRRVKRVEVLLFNPVKMEYIQPLTQTKL